MLCAYMHDIVSAYNIYLLYTTFSCMFTLVFMCYLVFCCTSYSLVQLRSWSVSKWRRPRIQTSVTWYVAHRVTCTVTSLLLFNQQNLANLAPRKIDWDLKRDISKKLEKLERRTQKAIVEILSELLTCTAYCLLVSVRETLCLEQVSTDILQFC